MHPCCLRVAQAPDVSAARSAIEYTSPPTTNDRGSTRGFNMTSFPRGSAALLLLPWLLLGAPAKAASDAEVKIEPGLWNVTHTTKTPIVDETNSNSALECLTGNPFTPELLTSNHPSCEIEKVRVSETEITWKTVCKNPLGGLTGTGRFKSTGTAAQGRQKNNMQVGAQSLVTITLWDGKRLGDCDMKLRKPGGKKVEEGSKSRANKKANKNNKNDKNDKAAPKPSEPAPKAESAKPDAS